MTSSPVFLNEKFSGLVNNRIDIYSDFLRDNEIFNCPLSSISQSQTTISPFFADNQSTSGLGMVVIKDWWEIPILVSYFIFIPFCIFLNLYLYSFFCIYICSYVSRYIRIDTFIYNLLHSTIVSTFVSTYKEKTISFFKVFSFPSARVGGSRKRKER